MNVIIETTLFSLVGLLAAAYLTFALADLAADHRRAKRRRRAERIEEEATAIVAALAAYEKIRKMKGTSDGNKREVSHEEDDAL